MSYPKEAMDQAPEKPGHFKENITWEVTSSDQLRKLVNDTLDEEILQPLAALKMGLSTLPSQTIDDRKQTEAKLTEITLQTIRLVRGLQNILREDPTKPIPIDHRYESGGGNPVVALDLIADAPFK